MGPMISSPNVHAYNQGTSTQTDEGVKVLQGKRKFAGDRVVLSGGRNPEAGEGGSDHCKEKKRWEERGLSPADTKYRQPSHKR